MRIRRAALLAGALTSAIAGLCLSQEETRASSSGASFGVTVQVAAPDDPRAAVTLRALVQDDLVQPTSRPADPRVRIDALPPAAGMAAGHRIIVPADAEIELDF